MDAASAYPATAIANWYFFNPYHVVIYLHLNRPLAQCCDKRKNRKLNPKRQGYVKLFNLILIFAGTYSANIYSCESTDLSLLWKQTGARNFTEAISIYITFTLHFE